MTQVYNEKRSDARRVFTTTMDYSTSMVENNKLVCNTGKGISSNISSGGISIFTSSELKEGQILALYSSKLQGGPISGRVKWCSMKSRNLYKVGIGFN